jgi:fructose-1,6-bisphosphatase/inositol monophosphatase family enzyme
MRRFGGDCYAYALLASGHIDVVIEAGLQPYDFLALVPVIAGAGGVITDWRGQPLGLDSDGRVVAAATPALHRELLDRLK